MLSTIIQRKFQLLGILTLISGLSGFYAYYKMRAQKKTIKGTQQQNNPLNLNTNESLLNESKVHSQTGRYQLQKANSIYSEFYFDRNLQSRKVLDHLDNQGITVENVYLYSPIIAVDQFKRFTAQTRKRRRLIRTINQDQYVNIMLNYEGQIEELIQRSRMQIVNDCQIDDQQFQNMVAVYQATEDINILCRNARNKLKSLTFVSNRKIPKPSVIKVINEEISFIKSRIYDRLRIKLQNEFNLSQDEILKIIQALIDDIVYEKFGYQRQQIQNALQKQWATELAQQIRELRKMRSQLESDIGNFTLLSQQSDAQSEDYKSPPSQGKTRSGANSLILQDQQIN